MKTNLRQVLAGLVLIPVLAMAGPQGGPGEMGGMNRGPMGSGPGFDPGARMERLLNNTELQQELGITEDQVSQIRTVLEANEIKLIDLQAEQQKARLALRKLTQQAGADETAVVQAVEAVGATHTEIIKIQTLQRMKIHAILGDEVVQKMRSTMRERRDERREDRREDRRGNGRDDDDSSRRGPGSGLFDE